MEATTSDIRFLQFYETFDRERHLKWLNSNPKNLQHLNLQRFKLLLCLNLCHRNENQAASNSNISSNTSNATSVNIGVLDGEIVKSKPY